MLIGQPKVADFDPLTDEELTQLQSTLDTLLGNGELPNTPIGVDLGVLARIFATIDARKAPVVERPKLVIPGLIADAHLADE